MIGEGTKRKTRQKKKKKKREGKTPPDSFLTKTREQIMHETK